MSTLIGLIFSSLAAGLIATFVMVLFQYLPLLWSGNYFDILGALGSWRTHVLDARARFIGAVLYFAGGIVFAFLYGVLVLGIRLNSEFLYGGYVISIPGLPTEVNFVYPLLGIAMGLGHGVIVALIMTVLISRHPLEYFHTRFILVVSQLIGHVVFGMVVMFFQSQFLQLLLDI